MRLVKSETVQEGAGFQLGEWQWGSRNKLLIARGEHARPGKKGRGSLFRWAARGRCPRGGRTPGLGRGRSRRLYEHRGASDARTVVFYREPAVPPGASMPALLRAPSPIRKET